MYFPPLQDIKIIGIDPGTTSLGICIVTINPYTYQVSNLDANTIFANKLPSYDKYLSSIHGDLMARIFAYRSYLEELFIMYKPTLIGSESPFFYRTHPGAYGPLVETLAAIREAVWRYDNTLPLITIPPSNVKKAIGAKGNANKDDVFKALLNYTPFNLDPVFISQLDEHAIDAIAVTAGILNDYVWRQS